MLPSNNPGLVNGQEQAGGKVLRIRVRMKSVVLAAIPFAALIALSACAATEPTQPSAKLSDMFATPEWAKANNAKTVAQRAITQDDLLTADGRCAVPAEQMTAPATDGAATPDAGAPAGQGTLPAVQGGVALAMTECQVVLRTGAPDTFNISAEGTERITTMTVTRGTWPGLYRFRGGRLVSIERVDVPAPPKPVRSAKSKKTATKSQPMPLRGAQQ